MLRDGEADRATARAVGATLGAHPRLLGGAARARGAVRQRRDLLRHPPRALPAGDGARAIPISRRRSSAWSRRRAATKRALVHGDVSPKNILIGPRGPGAARRRVRVVGRSGVRPRVLPQPPAAEVPLDAGGDAGASSPRSRRSPRPTSRASTGSRAKRSSGAPPRCCRGCCSPASTASRRSSTSTTTRDRDLVRRVAGALLRRPVARLGDVAAAWQEALATR